MNHKWHRLLALLTGIFLLLCCFWVLAEMPAFTAENAFYRVERAAFLQESTFLEAPYLSTIHYSGRGMRDGKYFVYSGIGVTENALHVTELQKKPPFSRWYADEEMVTIPLTGDLTAEWNPWGGAWDTPLLVYTPLTFDHGCATIAVGELGFTQEFDATESGLVSVSFYAYSTDPTFDPVRDQVQWRQLDLLPVHYNETQKTQDVRLTVTLYDSEGREIEQLERVYPKYE